MLSTSSAAVRSVATRGCRRHPRRAGNGRLSTVAVLTAMLAAFLVTLVGPAAGTASAATPGGAVIDNGTVQLGVDQLGALNYNCAGNGDEGCPPPSAGSGTPVVGLRYMPSNFDSTSPGCPCEGWGIADAGSGLTGYVYSGEQSVTNVSLNSFTSTAQDADSDVSVTDSSLPGYGLDVDQNYAPSAISPNLYQDTVTVTNSGSSDVTDLRYRRSMDWDIEPTAYDEFVTVAGHSPELLFDSDNGFQVSDPLSARSYIESESVCGAGYTGPCEFSDLGPTDHGALFDFGLGELAVGASRTFVVYYGAAPSEDVALSALAAGGAEVYSLGESDTPDGPTLGTPATFMFGFVTSKADVSIDQSPSPDPVRVGHYLRYRLAVTNDGPEKAAGVQVQDVLPPDTTFVAATPDQGSCTGGTTVTCTLGDIDNGGTAHVKVVVVPHVVTDALSNTATVTTSSADTALENNTSTSSVEVDDVPSAPGVPSDFSATPGDGSVDLSWTAPTDDGGSPITGYNVYASTESGDQADLGDPVCTTSDASDTACTVPGLTNGTKYYFIVEAANEVAPSGVSDQAAATPRTVPGSPTDLSATPGDRHVDLSWTPPTDDGGSPVTAYNVYEATSPGGEDDTGTPVCQVSGASCTVSDLTNAATYYFTVEAVNAAGSSVAAEEASATPIGAPDQPTDLSATPGDGHADLSWTAPANDGGSPVTGYAVYEATSPGGEDDTGAPVCSGADTTCTVSDLTNGTTYYFTVEAVNDAGSSVAAEEASATPIGAPDQPTDLSATPGDGHVDLSWTAPANDGGPPITTYKVFASTSPGGEDDTGTPVCQASGTSCTVSELTNGTTYYFTVEAVNDLGSSAASVEASATPRARPARPTNLSAIPGGAHVDLSWVAPTDDGGSPVTGYNVYEATSPGAEDDTGTPVCSGADTTCTVSDLTNGTTYYFTVEAVNDLGSSAASEEASATPAARPTRPMNLSATPGDAHVDLSWTGSANDGGSPITAYRVFTSTSPGAEDDTGTPVCSGADTTCTVSDLTNGTTYYFTVEAVNDLGSSAASVEASATPAARPVPRNPTITATVSSTTSISRYGWYRTPVQVTFRCTTNGAALTSPCPVPVTLSGDGGGQSVSGSVTAVNGGAATVVAGPFNIDQTAPTIHVTGARNGALYDGPAPAVHCVAHDVLSGVRSCRVVQHTSGTGRTSYRVVAVDKAGNVSRLAGSFRSLTAFVEKAAYRHGHFVTHTGSAYIVGVYAASRPRYYEARPARQGNGRPFKTGKRPHAQGDHLWTVRIHITRQMGGLRNWNLGAKTVGDKLRLVRLVVLT